MQVALGGCRRCGERNRRLTNYDFRITKEMLECLTSEFCGSAFGNLRFASVTGFACVWVDKGIEKMNKTMRVGLAGVLLFAAMSGSVFAEVKLSAVFSDNPHFPALRTGHRLFQRPSPQKQCPSNPIIIKVPAAKIKASNDTLKPNKKQEN